MNRAIKITLIFSLLLHLANLLAHETDNEHSHSQWGNENVSDSSINDAVLTCEGRVDELNRSIEKLETAGEYANEQMKQDVEQKLHGIPIWETHVGGVYSCIKFLNADSGVDFSLKKSWFGYGKYVLKKP